MNFSKEYNEINNRLCNIVKETIDIEADIAVKLEVIEAVLHLSCISKLKMTREGDQKCKIPQLSPSQSRSGTQRG